MIRELTNNEIQLVNGGDCESTAIVAGGVAGGVAGAAVAGAITGAAAGPIGAAVGIIVAVGVAIIADSTVCDTDGTHS